MVIQLEHVLGVEMEAIDFQKMFYKGHRISQIYEHHIIGHANNI